MTPWVRFRVTRFGGIQPARVMRATTGIGAERFQAMPKRFAKQGLTHLADATLVPCRPGESKWLGILVLRTQELGECVS